MPWHLRHKELIQTRKRPHGASWSANSRNLPPSTVSCNRKRRWSATLPQPTTPDCEAVLGKVPGPTNHVFCATHGHIVDTSSKTVIAHDLDEYKRLFRR